MVSVLVWYLVTCFVGVWLLFVIGFVRFGESFDVVLLVCFRGGVFLQLFGLYYLAYCWFFV